MSSFMGIKESFPAALGVGTLFSLGSCLTSRVVIWLGLNICRVGSLSALSFGGIVGIITVLADAFFNEYLSINDWRIRLPASMTLSTLSGYGLSYMGFTLNIVATPITFSTAVILTLSGVAASVICTLTLRKIFLL